MSLFPKKLNRFERAGGRLVEAARTALVKAYFIRRESLGIKQADIARDLSVDRSVVNRILKGEGDMTFRQFGKIAESLDMTAEICLTPKEDMRIEGSNVLRLHNEEAITISRQVTGLHIEAVG